ncbi:MAG: PH domain-containing protein [Actinomycetota bacterium]
MADKPSVKLKKLWYTVWAVWLVFIAAGIIILALPAGLIAAAAAAAAILVVTAGLLFWIPAAYRQAEYSIREEGVNMRWGVIWKKQVTVPYPKITNVDITRGPLERFWGIATVHLQTAGAGGQQGQKAELKLPGIENPDYIKDKVLSKIKVKGDSYAGAYKAEDQILVEILSQVKTISSILDKKLE